MNTDSGHTTNSSVTGGKLRQKKNITAKKHKKGNKVLAAWRDHVKVVAKEEGIAYGKEAMQLAKKGKYGKQWTQIKASLDGSNKRGGEVLEADENSGVNDSSEMANSDISESGAVENSDVNDSDSGVVENSVDNVSGAVENSGDNVSGAIENSNDNENMPEAYAITNNDEDLIQGETAQQLLEGGRRKRSRKQKGKKNRKSKKHYRSHKR